MTECKTCHEQYDEAKQIHVPLETEQARGMMTIRFVTGCKVLDKPQEEE